MLTAEVEQFLRIHGLKFDTIAAASDEQMDLCKKAALAACDIDMLTKLMSDCKVSVGIDDVKTHAPIGSLEHLFRHGCIVAPVYMYIMLESRPQMIKAGLDAVEHKYRVHVGALLFHEAMNRKNSELAQAVLTYECEGEKAD